ncbi:peptidoglycan DD-metalloendopeptidase family protein [bacterium]|nr:peptidoglycan DD-metalloendopeptidase family protein [bacterium]MDA7744680.1 peptidoglycan DD-metalloendopeptidase family protein [bacterium]
MNKSKIILLAATIFSGMCLWLIFSHESNTASPRFVEAIDSLVGNECSDEFGIDAAGYNVIKGKICPNQFLADILLPLNISYQEITSLAEKSKMVYDIRKLNSGKDYTLICSEDSNQKALFFIYEMSAVDFIVYDLTDTISVYRGSRQTKIEEKTASGTIESSLYMTLMNQGLSPALAMEMADIYAWSIDFYRIQKGDYFKLIYTVKKVEEEVVGIDNIQAAVFNHFNSPYYAFEYEQENEIDYFDEQGNSLRKAFLQAPLKFSRISSGFTKRRFHPVQKRYKAHLGTDYAAPSGTPIMSVGDGVITEAQYKKFNGNYVKVKHNGTYTTQYLHMSKIASGIRPGVRVRQGQVIGYVGSTGLATGPHVCFRFWKNGQQVDHRREKLPPSLPIKSEYKADYMEHLSRWKSRLDAISIGTLNTPTTEAAEA